MSAIRPAHSDPPPRDTAASFEEVLRRLRPRLKAILAGYAIPLEDAEDILQEVLLAAFCKWDSIEMKDAWLAGTLRNQCSFYWRRRRASLFKPVDLGVLEALAVPLPPPQERAEQVWDLETLTADLSSRHREMLRLYFGLGLSSEEVADRLGYCPASVRKLTGRCVARMQKRSSSLRTSSRCMEPTEPGDLAGPGKPGNP
ncbi:MAG: sigma-70 family RNA polymerase sigma factor [Acidobacteriota bacterium]|nr:sigma-70 family RNA polymerase sigma factor [Acidobacteriota bacterium]